MERGGDIVAYVAYPRLASEIKRRGIKKVAIAERIKVTEKALSNKMSGKTSFSWEQVCEIAETFFPDLSKEYLFERADQ